MNLHGASCKDHAVSCMVCSFLQVVERQQDQASCIPSHFKTGFAAVLGDPHSRFNLRPRLFRSPFLLPGSMSASSRPNRQLTLAFRYPRPDHGLASTTRIMKLVCAIPPPRTLQHRTVFFSFGYASSRAKAYAIPGYVVRTSRAHLTPSWYSRPPFDKCCILTLSRQRPRQLF